MHDGNDSLDSQAVQVNFEVVLEIQEWDVLVTVWIAAIAEFCPLDEAGGVPDCCLYTFAQSCGSKIYHTFMKLFVVLDVCMRGGPHPAPAPQPSLIY
jgi:hypothetical protein